jgi:hypothetical protein
MPDPTYFDLLLVAFMLWVLADGLVRRLWPAED